MTIEYSTADEVTPEELEELANSFGGEHPRPVERNRKALSGSIFVATARDAGRLVGVIRLVGDGAYVLHVADMLVSPAYQLKGIGRNLMQLALDFAKQQKIGCGDSPGEFTLFSTKEGKAFYRKFPFVSVPNGMVLADSQHRIDRERKESQQFIEE